MKMDWSEWEMNREFEIHKKIQILTKSKLTKSKIHCIDSEVVFKLLLLKLLLLKLLLLKLLLLKYDGIFANKIHGQVLRD